MQPLAVPDDGKEIAADVVGARRDDRVRDRGCQRGVHRVAAGPENAQPSGGGEGLAGGYHPARSVDGFAGKVCGNGWHATIRSRAGV